jgi:hypothetical protein
MYRIGVALGLQVEKLSHVDKFHLRNKREKAAHPQRLYTAYFLSSLSNSLQCWIPAQHELDAVGIAEEKGGVMFLKSALATILAGSLCGALFAAPPAQQHDAPANTTAEIISDNLDQVADTAEQILDVLNKDPGMMVEFKSELAKDAGSSGQILDESDLSEEAISELLQRDL